MIDFEQILEENCKKLKNREYAFEKVDGKFQGITYDVFLDKARTVAGFLLDKGFQDKPIMIYGDNSINLMLADLAVLNYVGISVCISKEWKEEDVLRTLRFLEIPCVIYGEEKQEIMERVKQEMPELTYIPMSAFSNMGNTDIKCIPQDNEKCCKIVFSSGTTARPKAVMLSKKNIFAGVHSLYKRCPFCEQDATYLFLPLSHTYAGIYNFLYSLVFGFQVYLCSGVKELAKEILEVNPTIFCGVPLIYRRLYEGYGANIHKAFGNRIRYLFCGGAHFDEELRKAYKDSGLDMMEAYALTETASTFAIQYPNDPDVHCTGTIAEDINVKILAPDKSGIGEVAVKGDNVFLGYAKDDEATRQAFTEDGYFKTGDLGYLRKDELHGGYRLYLTGRIKKILIGENGENVDPQQIEKLICEKDTDITKAVVFIANGKLGCRVYLGKEKKCDWDLFFEKLNETLPKHEKVQYYEMMEDSLDKRWKQ